MIGLALVLRVAMRSGADAFGVNVVFRGIAGIVTLVSSGFIMDWKALAGPLSMVGGQAALAALFFFLTGIGSLKAVQLGNLGLSWGVLRCSMILPVLASIVFWHEIPLQPVSLLLIARTGGVVLACTSIFLIGWRQTAGPQVAKQTIEVRRKHQRWLMWLGLAFLTQGGWEIVLRSTRGFPDNQARTLFVTIAFAGAAILSGSVAVLRKVPLGKKELSFGILAGLLSLLASGARVWALRDIDGIIVFPITTISVMLAVQVLAVAIWREQINKMGFTGFVLAIASMVLLTMPKSLIQRP